MRPLYFGAGRGLFGCWHPAPPGSVPVLGLVLCHPLFGEHVQQYRLFNRIAVQAAARGVPALRFDWFGTGDSAGELVDTSLDRWRADLRDAVAWLRRQARVGPVVLLGSRFGATLAVEAAVGDDDVVGLALWDPVVSGATYLDELSTHHEKGLARYLAGTEGPVGAVDLLGFEVPKRLLAEIGAVRLDAHGLLHGQRVLLVGDDGSLAAAGPVLGPAAAELTCHRAEFPPGWLEPEESIYDILVPAPPMRECVEWIAGCAR